LSIFNAYPAADHSDLDFVAYAKEPEGFRHFSKLPSMELGTFKDLRYGGSGGQAFYELLDKISLRMPHQSGDDFNVYNEWVLRACTLVGCLICQQRATGAGLTDGWGGGFEIAFYDGNRERFTKLDKILYLEWEIKETEPGSYVIALLEPFIFQWALDERTIFYSETPGQRTIIHIVDPPWRKSDTPPFSLPAPPMTFVPNYIINIVQGHNLDGSDGYGSFARSVGPGRTLAEIKTGLTAAGSTETRTDIGIAPGFIEEVVKFLLPANGTLQGFYFMGAKAPWPPPARST
jgi:hypothetical protein